MDYAERIVGFIERERRCCPFLTFEIVFEPEERGIWLYFGSDERVTSAATSVFRLTSKGSLKRTDLHATLPIDERHAEPMRLLAWLCDHARPMF